MLEFGHFLFLFLTCRCFPFLALCEFIDYCKQYLTLPDWTDWTGPDGSETDKTDMGNLPTLLPGTFLKVGRRAGQLDSGTKTSFHFGVTILHKRVGTRNPFVLE